VARGLSEGQRNGRMRPDETQAARQFAQHRTNRERGIQMQGNDQPDHDWHTQLALALVGGGLLGQDMRNRVGRDGARERFDSQGAGELAFGLNLPYSESQAVTPWHTFTAARESMP